MLDPSQIARLLLDHNPDDHDHALPCFMCGRRLLYRGSRFCCDRCRDFYDAGNDPGSLRTKITYTRRDGTPMQPGAEGFLMSCAHCRKEFESRGLRCCSPACETAYREQQDNLATLAAAGIEPATKRKCENENCDALIPTWRKGRRVLSTARFCSAKCRQTTFRRNGKLAPDYHPSRKPVL